MPVAVPNACRTSSRDQPCRTAGCLKIRHESPRLSASRVRCSCALECQEHISEASEVGAVPVRLTAASSRNRATAFSAADSVPAGRPSVESQIPRLLSEAASQMFLPRPGKLKWPPPAWAKGAAQNGGEFDTSPDQGSCPASGLTAQASAGAGYATDGTAYLGCPDPQ